VNRDPGAGNGSCIPPVLARPGLVQVYAHVPASTSDLTGLRVLLIADILARVVELRRLQALTVWMFARKSAEQERAAIALNVHPPATSPPPGGRADVRVLPAASPAAYADDGADTIAIAPACLPSTEPEDVFAGADALAVRLALLSCPYSEPVEITEATLVTAQATLGQWRSQVAEWAESPSRPIPEEVIAASRTALDQLDTAAIVAMLRALAAENETAPGAKFEAFMHADRVLGLDLASGIGRSG
jgi:hypothetical protein